MLGDAMDGNYGYDTRYAIRPGRYDGFLSFLLFSFFFSFFLLRMIKESQGGGGSGISVNPDAAVTHLQLIPSIPPTLHVPEG